MTNLPGLKVALLYAVDRLNTAIKYGSDMETSTELAMKDAQYILNTAIEIYNEQKEGKTK